MNRKNLIIAVTGASGSLYAKELIWALNPGEYDVHLVASNAGKLVYELEIGVPFENDVPPGGHLYNERDFTAPFASGSFPSAGMVVVPCSMGTLAAIANGFSRNVIHRAAEVCMKERRKLILVPRETPLSRIHIENMLKVTEAGGIILPAMPGFYHHPQSVTDIAKFVVARILDQLGIPQALVKPWNPERT